MVASVPDSDPRMPSRNRMQRAYQLVDEPESAVTIALSGRRSDSSQATRMGFTGLAVEHALPLDGFPPAGDVLLDGFPP